MVKLAKNIVFFFIKIAYGIGKFMVPVNKKMVIYIAFHGRGYLDNPKALHMKMSERSDFQDFTCIWALKKPKDTCIKNSKIVRYEGLRYFYYLARSNYWISNCKLPKYVTKKKSQIYLQTWHGTPLKRLGRDITVQKGTTFYRTGLTLEEMKHTYDDDVSKYNYMISPNPFCTKVFQTAFGINQERLIETGYPRNDVLIKKRTQDTTDLKVSLGLPINKKIILYAPTWRDNQFALSGYTMKLEVDFYKWKANLGDEYIIVYKPHYLIVNTMKDKNDLQGFLYEMDANIDINKLYLVSDVLVTDYSSVFFDFALLNRPILFYMYDMEEYKEELRGFYLDVNEELPGNIYTTEDSLLQAIVDKNFDLHKLEIFNQKFDAWEDGNASNRVLDILMRGKG